MSTKQLITAAAVAAGLATLAMLAAHFMSRENADEDKNNGDRDDDDDKEEEEEEEEESEEEDREVESNDGLKLIDTTLQKSKSRMKKKKKKKAKRMKAGFLNALGPNGIDSPVATSKKKRVESHGKDGESKPETLEDKIISEFVRVSKNMQELTASGSTSAQLSALQRRRMSLVASLQQIRGEQSVARLELKLAKLVPPPPPPEPAELYRQSIAHRIMTDPDFTIEKSRPTGIQLEVQKTVRRAYWDSIRSKLSNGDNDEKASVLYDLVSQVVAGILSIREDSPKFQQNMAKAISDKIDLAFLKDQTSKGLLTLDSFAAVVKHLTEIIAQCQSPERDASREEWLTQTISMLSFDERELNAIDDGADAGIAEGMRLIECVESVFDGLFEMVETTKRDLINYQIKMMRAHLTQDGKGIKYQREKFSARLDSGEITLENTSAFLAHGLQLSQTLPGIKGRDSKMIDRSQVTAGSAVACRHLLAVSIVDHMYSNSTINSTDVISKSGSAQQESAGNEPTHGPPALPETLDTEGTALEAIRDNVFRLVEATSCILKVNQFALSVLKVPALSSVEKAKLYDFLRNHSRYHEQLETVKEITVAADSTGTNDGGDATTPESGSAGLVSDGSSPKTKKMLLVTRLDPHGKRLQKVRLESGAIFASDTLGERGTKLTTDDIEKLETLFYQLEGNTAEDAVFKAATTILRNATLRAIQGAMAAQGKLDADELVQATAGKSPLGLPEPALKDFGAVLQGILQLTARNFEIHMDAYKEVVMSL